MYSDKKKGAKSKYNISSHGVFVGLFCSDSRQFEQIGAQYWLGLDVKLS